MAARPDFELVRDVLRARAGGSPASFLVPAFLCVSGSTDTTPVDVGDPYVFFADLFDRILAEPGPPDHHRGVHTSWHVYQSFPRTFAALDGRIGTALTQIAFLPFLRNRLGIDVFVCLPAGRIGRANRKGARGSPFAVSDPFEIDASLCDPLLSGVPGLVQYRALTQACELLSIQAGSIVPMATLAMDSPLFAAVPELGYWWQAEPGQLVHCSSDARGLSRQPDLSPPDIDPDAARRFVAAPDPATVTTTDGYHVSHPPTPGEAPVTLANAFPDVLAGEAATYTWGDVATVRYGAGVVPAPAGRPGPVVAGTRPAAWDLMPAIIAWRHRVLGEHFFLIDVSPSVPPELLRRAREISGAWEPRFEDGLGRLGAGRLGPEDAVRLLADLHAAAARGACNPAEDITFVGEELWAFDLPDTEFDAVCGPLAYCVSAHTHNIPVLAQSLLHHLCALEKRKTDSPYFAGVANHDTMPPAPWASALLRVIYQFLPGAVPLTFSGTEWGATVVTNKEFGFDTSPQLLSLRASLSDDLLALFNDVPLDWRTISPDYGQVGLITRLAALRQRLGDLRGWGYEVYTPDSPQASHCFGYLRVAPERTGECLIVLANWSDAPVETKWTALSAELVLSVPGNSLSGLICNGDKVVVPARSVVVAATSALACGQDRQSSGNTPG
ncbi:hypothetical protein ACGGAQ_30310 [Micromonospora sp. NPDC047557]|uniref:hypothetical protein n=1 Tax=Micromonospora sp. NPDC047557 TaxID=3364250 RepID=UPI003719D80F